MKQDVLMESVEVPEGCSASFTDFQIMIKGPKGAISTKLTTPRIQVKIENNHVVLRSEKPSKREKRMINTYKAHVKNMFKGVTEEHTYKLKVCSGHFPMTVAYKNNILEVKNFLGEKVPRSVKLNEAVNVQIQGDIITITSVNKETAGNAASAIEKITRRNGFDKRVFQDGIYLTEKDGKTVA